MSLTLRPTGLGLGGVELPGIVPASTDHDGEPHAGRNAPNTRRIIAADGLFAQSPPSTTCKLRRSYFDNDTIRVRSASTDGEISRVSPSGCARRSRHSARHQNLGSPEDSVAPDPPHATRTTNGAQTGSLTDD